MLSVELLLKYAVPGTPPGRKNRCYPLTDEEIAIVEEAP